MIQRVALLITILSNRHVLYRLPIAISILVIFLVTKNLNVQGESDARLVQIRIKLESRAKEIVKKLPHSVHGSKLFYLKNEGL